MMAQAEVLDFKTPYSMTPEMALAGVWPEFVRSVAAIGTKSYANDFEMKSVLNHNLILMHKLLLACGEYRAMVNGDYRNLVRTKYWGNCTIHEDSLGKAGLFSVYHDAMVPLHDHPATRGVMMVLDGEVLVERYTLHEQYRDVYESGVVEMDRSETSILRPFEVTWFDKDKSNIHGLEALTDKCVLLKLEVAVQSEANRSWYFPVAHRDSTQSTFKARRIVSRYL